MSTVHSEDPLLRIRADSLYSTMVPYGLMGVAASGLLCLTYWPKHGCVGLVVWQSLMLGMLPIRFGLYVLYRKLGAVNRSAWVVGALIAMAVYGLIWGAGICFMLAIGDPAEVTVASCICLGAVCLMISDLAYWQNHGAFQVPALLLASLGYLLNPEPAYIELAVASSLLAAAQLFVVSRLGKRIVSAMRISVENERLATELALVNSELLALSLTDALTGLANRRHYDDALEKECARAQRTGTWLSILAIDVDHFKRYNDAYGHGAGDDCLRAIAFALEESTRRGIDLVARPGGEEFVVLLPDTDMAGAAEAAERVRASVEALSNDRVHYLRRTVTVSIGVASIRPSLGDTTDVLAWDADEALYRAKDKGRNCVIVAADRRVRLQSVLEGRQVL